jgi:hypothetical protein
MTREILIQPWRELYAREIRGSMAHECWACADTWPGQHPSEEGGLVSHPAISAQIAGR